MNRLRNIGLARWLLLLLVNVAAAPLWWLEKPLRKRERRLGA